MKTIEIISSECGKEIIEIIQKSDGSFYMEKYLREYDEEERCYYTIKSLPSPDGIFSNKSNAILEAKRILSKCWKPK